MLRLLLENCVEEETSSDGEELMTVGADQFWNGDPSVSNEAPYTQHQQAL